MSADLPPSDALNVLGGPLLACSYDPLTGWMRTGCCEADAQDVGRHHVCVKVTDAFLEFSKLRGNDLSTPRPEYRFAGLKPGDRVIVEGWQKAQPGQKVQVRGDAAPAQTKGGR